VQGRKLVVQEPRPCSRGGQMPSNHSPLLVERQRLAAHGTPATAESKTLQTGSTRIGRMFVSAYATVNRPLALDVAARFL
jgi:hypothetical protein